MSRIELFITPECLSFASAMEVWKALREACPDEDYEVIDCPENRERARRAGVVVEPAFVVDGRVVLVGLPQKDRLIKEVKTLIK